MDRFWWHRWSDRCPLRRAFLRLTPLKGLIYNPLICLCGNEQREPLDQTPTPHGVLPLREVATGVCSSGFFSPVLRTIASAFVGSAEGNTASHVWH